MNIRVVIRVEKGIGKKSYTVAAGATKLFRRNRFREVDPGKNGSTDKKNIFLVGLYSNRHIKAVELGSIRIHSFYIRSGLIRHPGIQVFPRITEWVTRSYVGAEQ